MKKTFLGAKLHQATITGCEIDYEGSISIDQTLLEMAGILPYEQVHVYNITNGQRFITYAIAAPHGSGIICTNGACARLAVPQDRVIICAYVELDASEWKTFSPKVVLLDKHNSTLTHQ